MKKLILFAAILFAGVSVVKAQSSTGTVITDQNKTVKLNVILEAVQTLTLNSTAEIDLKYSTEDDYNEGVTSESITDHLTVSSTGAFAIDVTATEFIKGNNERVDIALNTIKLTASSGTNYDLEATAVRSGVPLSTTGNALIDSSRGGFNQNINVEYVGGNGYRDFYQQGKDNTFTTTITYSLVAK